MRYFTLDCIRCIAIILLLLGHISRKIHSPLGLHFGIQNFYYVTFGGLAVTIFLILSGASLEVNYGDRKIKYFLFLLKRFLRIYPVYYLSLIFGIFVFAIKSYQTTGDFFAHFKKLHISHILLSLSGGFAYAGKWGGPFVGTSWFIALIMTMYIFYPFLSRQIKKNTIISISILFAISLLSRFILGSYKIIPMRPLDWFPLCRIFEFSLGIFLAGRFLNKETSSNLVELSFLESFIKFISEISFPLFLVHYTLLDYIPYLMNKGISQLYSIIIFLIVSIAISYIILAIDKRLQAIFLKKIF